MLNRWGNYECATCGYPGLRPEGHAEWCARLSAHLRAIGGLDENNRKTHCIHGHLYDYENTYSPPSNPNKRVCRTCAGMRPRVAPDALTVPHIAPTDKA